MLISKFDRSDVNSKIANMEKRYRIILPRQYREFLCKYNGGYTPKTKVRVDNVSTDIRGFYGIGNVQLNLEQLELQVWIDNNVIPIACDSFGNYFVIGIDDDILGKIFLCEHEEGNKLLLIAEDFVSFVKLCKSDVISEASRRSIKQREEDLIAKGKGGNITDALRRLWQAEIDKYSNMIQEEVIID